MLVVIGEVANAIVGKRECCICFITQKLPIRGIFHTIIQGF